MPITDLGSYVTTGQEFEVHWTDVDADRVANALAEFALPDGYARTNLSADVAALAAALTAQEDLDNALTLATSGRNTLRAALRDRVIEFRKTVEFRLKGSGYDRALPATPHEQGSEQKMLKALDDMASVWTRINAETGVANFTPPLLLQGGYALADFQADVALLRTKLFAVTEAENDAQIGRKKRDLLLDPLRDRFVSYRMGIEIEYGEQNAFTQSLPDVYPAPGSTPDAVVLSGDWDAGQMAAAFSWTESSAATLDRYELRMSPGASYDSANASVVDTFSTTTTSTETTAGLTAPGDVASFKIYVVLSTGNEAGSNAVTVTRV